MYIKKGKKREREKKRRKRRIVTKKTFLTLNSNSTQARANVKVVKRIFI